MVPSFTRFAFARPTFFLFHRHTKLMPRAVLCIRLFPHFQSYSPGCGMTVFLRQAPLIRILTKKRWHGQPGSVEVSSIRGMFTNLWPGRQAITQCNTTSGASATWAWSGDKEMKPFPECVEPPKWEPGNKRSLGLLSPSGLCQCPWLANANNAEDKRALCCGSGPCTRVEQDSGGVHGISSSDTVASQMSSHSVTSPS